jgi:hypothetical protein
VAAIIHPGLAYGHQINATLQTLPCLMITSITKPRQSPGGFRLPNMVKSQATVFLVFILNSITTHICPLHASETGDSNGDVIYTVCVASNNYIVHGFVPLLESRKQRYDGWPIHSSSHDIEASIGSIYV